ncbi:Vitrin, partial [Pseudolycoriella hygida]
CSSPSLASYSKQLAKMKKSFLLLFQIILGSTAVLAKSIDASKELQYLGTYKSVDVGEDGVKNYNENDYYVSPNSAIWSSADADCRFQLGPNATLVAIESLDEWEFLRVMLENYGFGTTYWTSGMYDPARVLWRWVANNQAFPPWAPWGNGFPSAPNQLLRVLQYYTNRYDAEWRTVPSTQLHRYICELQRVTVAVPCYQTNDLAIVLDASGSIGAANFQIALEFVDQLTAAFTRHDASRLTYIVYSTAAISRIPLVNTFTPPQISEIIRATPFTGGGTATHLGIDMALSQFESSPRPLPRNMVVLTDGASSNPALTRASAERATQAGIRSFSVGITQSVNQQELLIIAGNDPSRVFHASNFAQLIQLLAPLMSYSKQLIEMKKSFVFLLQIVLASTAVLPKSIDASKELQYIGTYKSVSVGEDGVRNYHENDYYIGVNAAIWSRADEDCRFLGPHMTLVAIESEEEWAFLQALLNNVAFGTTYWTSGMYDSSRQLWMWTANNQELPPWAPWRSGFPSASNQLVRVLMSGNIWATVFNTQLHRYICEFQHVTVAVPCHQTNDLAIVLDASGSMGADNFQIALDVVDQLAAAFTRHHASRLTYIVYSTTAISRIPLVNTFTPQQISHIIRTTAYTGGSTATHLGIDMAVSQFDSSPRAFPRNLVVVTGSASNNRDLTEASAQRANEAGIRTFSVGIAPNVDQLELLAIAGSDPTRVFTASNFTEFIQLLAPLSLKICN